MFSLSLTSNDLQDMAIFSLSIGVSAFDSPMGGGMMFSGGGDDDDPFSGGGGGGGGGGGVSKDSMADPASATDDQVTIVGIK